MMQNGPYKQRYRDAQPEMVCKQTFFRNQDAIQPFLKAVCSPQNQLKILNIGGGVLEPLLIAAICRLLMKSGQLHSYHQICIDSATEVHEIEQALRHKTEYRWDEHLVVDNSGTLFLPGMAQIFSATHSKVNTWLIDPVALSAHLQQWIDIGLAPDFSIPPNVCQSLDQIQSFIQHGLLINPELFQSLDFLLADISTQQTTSLSSEPAEILLSNFATQYPLWLGQGHTLMANIERLCAPDVIMQVANAYQAQQLWVDLIDRNQNFLKQHTVEVSARETFIVPSYTIDEIGSIPRLLPRTDVYCHPLSLELSGITRSVAISFTQSYAGKVIEFDRLSTLSEVMLEHDGLQEDGMMIFHAFWDPRQNSGYACLMEVDVMVAFGRNPLRF